MCCQLQNAKERTEEQISMMQLSYFEPVQRILTVRSHFEDKPSKSDLLQLYPIRFRLLFRRVIMSQELKQ
jgi:hypothetical protein